MGRLIETVGYDAINNSMRAVSQLKTSREKVLDVKPGAFLPGNRRQRFVSENFDTCSAFLLQGANPNVVGVFHVYPAQGLDTHPPQGIEVLADGQLIVIDGSASTVKPWLIKGLETDFGIKHVDTSPQYSRSL